LQENTAGFHILCLGMGDEPAEGLWISTKKRTGMGDIVVHVCHRPSDQEEQVVEAFY